MNDKKSVGIASPEFFALCVLSVLVFVSKTREFITSSSIFNIILVLFLIVGIGFVATTAIYSNFSKASRDLKKLKERAFQIPLELIKSNLAGVNMGQEVDLKIPIFLPDSIRSRHIHIIGATGSGKTESVILNFLKQDVARGLGTVILDAKGDKSFIASLKSIVPAEKLLIFDLGSETSLTYNPLEIGSALEAAQRLFSSLTWSEEYYKSKALSALQRIFQNHREKFDSNPNLLTISNYLENGEEFHKLVSNPKASADKDFLELSGLRDQIRSLSTGHLAKTLSPPGASQMQIENAAKGQVLYFRLQSLMSPQLVTTLGRLLINHLNYLAGTSHREDNGEESVSIEGVKNEAKLIPIYMDEFASFACPEFADLISKARSAGLALHFSHQSVGDLVEVSEGFLSRITDNSATKIVMRINDPDSAEFFARAFGTQMYQKITQRLINSKDVDTAEMLGEGSVRDAHQFRASPDLLKTLPTGVGAVLIAHGFDSPHGASTVFKIKFPLITQQRAPSGG